MVSLGGFELYSRWVPLIVKRGGKWERVKLLEQATSIFAGKSALSLV